MTLKCILKLADRKSLMSANSNLVKGSNSMREINCLIVF